MRTWLSYDEIRMKQKLDRRKGRNAGRAYETGNYIVEMQLVDGERSADSQDRNVTVRGLSSGSCFQEILV
jgi:hypothetical protein